MNTLGTMMQGIQSANRLIVWGAIIMLLVIAWGLARG